MLYQKEAGSLLNQPLLFHQNPACDYVTDRLKQTVLKNWLQG